MISKLRMIKNIIKKFISYKLNLNPMIKRFNKEKIGDRMSKKNFVKNLENINNLKILKFKKLIKLHQMFIYQIALKISQ